MKLTPWYLVAIAPIAVAGCSGAFLGHCAVLAVTLCIFVGTLTLGRQTVAGVSVTSAGSAASAAVPAPLASAKATDAQES
ncbi:MAG TPA: hypothetical protein VH044_10155 [Polyangiaceae bacterium]|jgi:hypothetical protein|nr:hypothetical protein [Polyangiaceae bacterium]